MAQKQPNPPTKRKRPPPPPKPPAKRKYIRKAPLQRDARDVAAAKFLTGIAQAVGLASPQEPQPFRPRMKQTTQKGKA